MIQVANIAANGSEYDLMVMLLPRRELIDSQPMIQARPPGLKVVNLRPRPSRRCGRENDKKWNIFHKCGLGLLGKHTICRKCRKRKGCFWPGQYSDGLKGADVMFGTQTHLAYNPSFLSWVKIYSGANRVLALLDEAHFLAYNRRRFITARHLVYYMDAVRTYLTGSRSKNIKKYLETLRKIEIASTKGLRAKWSMPSLYPNQHLAIQEAGWNTFGKVFRFLGFDLGGLAKARPLTRQKNPDGSIGFTASPIAIEGDVVVYSGTVNPKFASFRLESDFEVPFAGYRFLHHGTRWYNLASKIGMLTNFDKNSPQILDFFAGLIARRLEKGRSCLAVCKKDKFVECIRGLEERIRELEHPEAQVLPGELYRPQHHGISAIPVITYGRVGLNTFEHIDCAYCLNGYYVNDRIVNSVLQDVLADEFWINICISTKGLPRRRTAGAADPKYRKLITHELAPLALEHSEMDVVLQAVGRVRPYTKPREVITFQCAAHPKLDYDAEFDNLEEARSYFGVQKRRDRMVSQNINRAKQARAAGMIRMDIAAMLGVSPRTVSRYLNGK